MHRDSVLNHGLQQCRGLFVASVESHDVLFAFAGRVTAQVAAGDECEEGFLAFEELNFQSRGLAIGA